MATARYHKVKIGEHELNAETLMLGYGYDPPPRRRETPRGSDLKSRELRPELPPRQIRIWLVPAFCFLPKCCEDGRLK
jgi:hypothetical protein